MYMAEATSPSPAAFYKLKADLRSGLISSRLKAGVVRQFLVEHGLELDAVMDPLLREGGLLDAAALALLYSSHAPFARSSAHEATTAAESATLLHNASRLPHDEFVAVSNSHRVKHNVSREHRLAFIAASAHRAAAAEEELVAIPSPRHHNVSRRANLWRHDKPAVAAVQSLLRSTCLDPSQCLIDENATRPAVVLFLHLPKCGGTSVRTMFQRAGWHLTLWSLSQRRFLSAIDDALISDNATAQQRCHTAKARPKRCSTRLFVEWHLSPYNLSFIPTIEQRVKLLRPDAIFRSFLIMRPPIDLVSSNGAFWR